MTGGLYMVLGLLVALGILITFHEFGHFWVARRCGVKVLRFSIGFGPPLIRWHDKQGTEFVIAALPLGGYVKMLDEREGSVPEGQLEQAFNRKSVKQRMAIVAAGPLANFLLALVFFWILAMLGSTQVRPLIGSVEPDSIAAAAGLAEGQEITAIDGQPTSGWNAVHMALIRRLGESGTLDVTVREPGSTLEQTHALALQNWQRGVAEPDLLGSLGLHPWRPTLPPLLAQLDPQGPAQAAGLREGDLLLELNGEPIENWQTLVKQLRQKPDEPIRLAFERDGKRQELGLILSSRTQGSVTTGYLGAGVAAPVWPDNMLRTLGFNPLEALPEAVKRTWAMSALTLDSLKKMLLGQLSVKNLSGPITIAKVAGTSAQSGFGDFLNFLAYLSISLGVLNLLPIPVLDGGHLFFYLTEWVRGRPVSERIQGLGMQIGIALVLGVMLLAVINDLGRLFG
ncbi:zinc metallopeptidase RseP [Ventosimonas gracilis]|uniref:Zinc metalloprotease n=1 Tax=Ventosimonas gracilis TaxID=1680762 RepID=A0A139SUM7_9GAMM|nr:RIP metalloprotease RseP [Ventosimonas gracilis]KXU38161.1 zinc metallopeptidase RseP [Ventosimonas gracilis]